MKAEKSTRGRGGGAAAVAPVVPPFLTKCYDMVEDPSTDGTVSWSSTNNSFVIFDPHTFSRDLLPKHFKHNNLSSFVRQLNTYGFRKVDPDRYEFAHEGFLRGQKHLLKSITRRKPIQSASQSQQTHAKDTSVKACVEVGKFGFEEEIERLKRDKNVLMQELVKLRQHQQNTDLQILNLRQSLQEMEQNQQQMLSFLAMAVQSPSFLAQLMQQNGNNRWRHEANKKRRFPALEQGVVDNLDSPFDGQIVKYQPIVTETSNSGLKPVSATDVSGDLQPISNAANDLCANVDSISLGENPYSPGEGNFLIDFPDFYLEQLLASPLPESDGQIEPAISEFIKDLQLPEEEFQMDTS